VDILRNCYKRFKEKFVSLNIYDYMHQSAKALLDERMQTKKVSASWRLYIFQKPKP